VRIETAFSGTDLWCFGFPHPQKLVPSHGTRKLEAALLCGAVKLWLFYAIARCCQASAGRWMNFPPSSAKALCGQYRYRSAAGGELPPSLSFIQSYCSSASRNLQPFEGLHSAQTHAFWVCCRYFRSGCSAWRGKRGVELEPVLRA